MKKTMKVIRIVLLMLLAVVLVAGAGVFVYLQHLKPSYAGNLTLAGLQDRVEVIFDSYGIPHIYGSNEEDVYFALGYVHARERLFQMEMLRRVAAGRLAELLGQEMVKTDKFFRTIGLLDGAAKNAEHFFKNSSGPFQKAALAYLAGVNRFMEKGPLPVEFRLLGIPREPFTPRDIFLIGGFMAFGFAEGFQMDPLVTGIYERLGPQYLHDLVTGWPAGAEKIPVSRTGEAVRLTADLHAILAKLPVPRWIGSNGWVLGAEKTKSGRVMFANDTHMSFSQPSVWYEAHLECPGFSFYGNHAAGIPFGLIGHNRTTAWGLTMFENDDVDFFRERLNPENPDQVWVDDHWENLKIRKETIKVKGAPDVVFDVRISRHGPLLNDVDHAVSRVTSEPVAVWWSFNKFFSTTIEAFYRLAHARNLEDARRAAAMIDVPGLNVMYGDRNGNIAWWAAARLVRRPPHVNSKLFLDGAGGRDEPRGYYRFEQNPHSENPATGFVYSANNQPATLTGILYPGYYVPEDRARRIIRYLRPAHRWTLEEMKKMSTDCISPVAPQIRDEILDVLEGGEVVEKSPLHRQAYQILRQWNGDHQVSDPGPTLYYWLLSKILQNTFADELTPEQFDVFASSHLMKRTLAVFIRSNNSPWWDNIHTTGIKESRQMILAESFDQAVREIRERLGADSAGWGWGRVHTLEHSHPLGRKKPLDKIFNVGPFPAMGGNETIVNLGFSLKTAGHYPASFGPAMRIIIDFSDVEHSVSVNPTGQSGYFLSPHYDDQAHLYNAGRFRPQMMNRREIEKFRSTTLILVPE